MVASVKKRVCSNRECGKEFQPEYDVSIYCCRKCNDREKYLRRLDKKNGRVNGGENNVVPLHSDAVSPSSPTPQSEDILLRLTLAIEKQNEVNERQAVVLERIDEKLSNQDSLDDTMQLRILAGLESIKSDLPKVPIGKPLILPDTKESEETDDGFRPMTAAEREADLKKREAERETVVVQVKENEKTDGIAQSSTNFMSMIANMQSGKEGW